MLAGLFLQLPLPAAGARAAVVSVRLVAMAHAPTRPAAAHRRKSVPAHASRASEHRRHRPAPTVLAGLTRPAAAAHVRQPAAQARPAKPQAVAATASSPPSSAVDEVSAHDTNLVRRHLERFKFYPLSARRRGIGGDVEVAFRLTAGGKAEQVKVLASSGHDILDEAALQTVSRAQPFPVGGGQYRFRLRFRSL